MPALPTINARYIKRIRDLLRAGPNNAPASASVGSGNAEILFEAQDPGLAGNEITVEVVVPAGTSALAVSVVGKAISIELDVTLGVPNAPANTAALIAAAITADAAAVALVAPFLIGDGTGSLSVAVGPLSLSGGVSGSGVASIQSLPLNFLRAQDMASVLELLQDALDLPAPLTATGGTARSVQDAGAFVAGSQIGNRVVFSGNVTAALTDVEAVVVSNTANALFFASGALPAAPVAGDDYTIVGGFLDVAISALRDGKGPADAPAGNVYGDSRIVLDALFRVIEQLGGTGIVTQISEGTVLAGATATAVPVTLRGLRMRPDQFKDYIFFVPFEISRIVSNTEDTVYLARPLSGAPAATTPFVILDYPNTDASSNYTFAPGGQPTDNQKLAELILAAEAAVVAFTLPT